MYYPRSRRMLIFTNLKSWGSWSYLLFHMQTAHSFWQTNSQDRLCSTLYRDTRGMRGGSRIGPLGVPSTSEHLKYPDFMWNSSGRSFICKLHIRSDKQTARTAFAQFGFTFNQHLTFQNIQILCATVVSREKIIRNIYFWWFQPQTERKIPDMGN